MTVMINSFSLIDNEKKHLTDKDQVFRNVLKCNCIIAIYLGNCGVHTSSIGVELNQSVVCSHIACPFI